MTQAKTYIHSLDAAVVRGEQRPPGPNPKSIAGKVLGPIMQRLPQNRLAPARIDHEVKDGEELPIAGGLRAIHTPGHTGGHTSFLWGEHGGVLFVGDAAGNLFGRVGLPMGIYTEDMDQARESVRKIAALEFAVACFGHGGVLTRKAHADFRRFVEKMAR
jgi:glyoxylase-like metal-dependent hydrolase (beta-lactamase superfamily II)